MMDDLLREAFENWITAPPFEKDISRYGEDGTYWPGCYEDYQVHLAWDAWKESARIQQRLDTGGWIPVPTEPGWYWMQDKDAQCALIVEVFYRPGHDYLAISADPTCSGNRDFHAVEKMPHTSWYGPLTLPALPKEK